MTNPDFVNVVDPRNNLLCEPARLIFLKSLPFDDIIEELTTGSILHYQEKLPRCFDNLVELDYIGMPHNLQNVYFSCDSLHITLVLDLVFLKNFDSNFLPCD